MLSLAHKNRENLLTDFSTVLASDTRIVQGNSMSRSAIPIAGYSAMSRANAKFDLTPDGKTVCNTDQHVARCGISVSRHKTGKMSWD